MKDLTPGVRQNCDKITFANLATGSTEFLRDQIEQILAEISTDFGPYWDCAKAAYETWDRAIRHVDDILFVKKLHNEFAVEFELAICKELETAVERTKTVFSSLMEYQNGGSDRDRMRVMPWWSPPTLPSKLTSDCNQAIQELRDLLGELTRIRKKIGSALDAIFQKLNTDAFNIGKLCGLMSTVGDTQALARAVKTVLGPDRISWFSVDTPEFSSSLLSDAIRDEYVHDEDPVGAFLGAIKTQMGERFPAIIQHSTTLVNNEKSKRREQEATS